MNTKSSTKKGNIYFHIFTYSSESAYGLLVSVARNTNLSGARVPRTHILITHAKKEGNKIRK